MATTITASFARFKQNLEITDLQAETTSTRQKNVRSVVEDGLTVLDTFLTGSYSRNTMIAPLKEADIDIFIVLDPSYYYHYTNGQNGGQAALLDLVRRVLKKTYTKTPQISRSGQAVTITFTDFIVDVVPAFYRIGGGFLIPNSNTNQWIETDPKKHVSLTSSMNIMQSGNFVPIVKMIKAWNRNNNKHFSSFHLETLALEIFNNIHISDYPSGVRYFFDKGRELIAKVNLDPAGYGGDIGSYLNTAEKIQVAVTKFELAYDRAAKAEFAAKNGNVQIAINYWIMIFGSYFPAYG